MAKMKVTYENITPLMSKVNKRRIAVSFLSWILQIIIAIAFVVSFPPGGFFEIIGAFLGSLFLAWYIVGMLPGLFHIDSLYGSIKPLLFIPIIGWFIWFMIVCFAAIVIGMGVMIANIFKLIFKKPLIYFFEVDYFIKKEAAQNIDAAVTAAAYNNVMGQQNVQNNNSAESLAKLKEMLDNGLITENEYDVKKAEILSRM